MKYTTSISREFITRDIDHIWNVINGGMYTDDKYMDIVHSIMTEIADNYQMEVLDK
tara:strand:- start:150 stop:317 length:168 start_codon:yes stop_codon:yes gene_type:complete